MYIYLFTYLIFPFLKLCNYISRLFTKRKDGEEDSKQPSVEDSTKTQKPDDISRSANHPRSETIADPETFINEILFVPQSDDYNTSQKVIMGPSTNKMTNVTFHDTHQGYTQEQKSDMDSLRDAPFASDATLSEFFSRPIKIRSYQWTPTADFFQTFNPWSDYWQNLRVINRITNYKLMRCKMHVKFVINGNSFYYGRLIASYNPLPVDDNLSKNRQLIEDDLILVSQRPHVYLDPTNSQGGEMMLPFFFYKNCLDIVAQDWQKMGEINIRSFGNLNHANGATEPISVNVFAWAEDVCFSIPTHAEPGSLAPQSDEYSKKPVSTVATTVSKIAGSLIGLPVIGPFAKATQIGSTAVGAIASLFGFSRPVQLDVDQFVPRTKHSLANTNVNDDVMKLTLDCKQELTLDPRTVGLGDVDEMAINYIASRESYFTSFDWTVADLSEELLFNILVDPGLHVLTNLEYFFPACTFASLPFKYWRGSMKFRFQVICSKFHKGRLKFVYDPNGNATGTAEYNTAYTQIVDISDNTDFEIECGWGQPTTYREHIALSNTAPQSGAAPLNYSANAVEYGNGTLAVYVVNELSIPNTTAVNVVRVNVFVSAGDDFELAAPTTENLSRLYLSPQSEEVETEPEELEKMDSDPLNPGVIATMANKISIADQANLIHFGERVSSLRTLMKRYTLSELITHLDQINQVIRYNIPNQPGGMPDDAVVQNTVFGTNGGTERWSYGYPTLFSYILPAYAGWRGSVRYFQDSSLSFSTQSKQYVNRFQEPIQNNILHSPLRALDSPLQNGLYYNTFAEYTGLAATQTQCGIVNGSLSYEMPYYSNLRFVPAKRRSVIPTTGNPGAVDPFQQTHVFTYECFERSGFTPTYTYVAAGEDFNLFMYLGPPVMYQVAFQPQG